MTAPVVLIIFRRPDLTRRVFERVREARPEQLFLVADGPRPGIQGEEERCQAARNVVADIDWDCEVYRDYADENMGCKRRVSSGLDWVFDSVERAIILEDDCVPSISFFSFCQALLNEYQHDDRVVMISGHNPLGSWRSSNQSYHFSNFGGIWGWATWRESWDTYHNAEAVQQPSIIRQILRNVLVEQRQVKQRTRAIERMFAGKVDTWDYQWFWARTLQSGLSVVPALNLVSNIGFGPDAAHTTNSKDARGNLRLHDLSLPLKPPVGLYPDREYDRRWFEHTHGFRVSRILEFLRHQKRRIEEIL